MHLTEPDTVRQPWYSEEMTVTFTVTKAVYSPNWERLVKLLMMAGHWGTKSPLWVSFTGHQKATGSQARGGPGHRQEAAVHVEGEQSSPGPRDMPRAACRGRSADTRHLANSSRVQPWHQQTGKPRGGAELAHHGSALQTWARWSPQRAAWRKGSCDYKDAGGGCGCHNCLLNAQWTFSSSNL